MIFSLLVKNEHQERSTKSRCALVLCCVCLFKLFLYFVHCLYITNFCTQNSQEGVMKI